MGVLNVTPVELEGTLVAERARLTQAESRVQREARACRFLTRSVSGVS